MTALQSTSQSTSESHSVPASHNTQPISAAVQWQCLAFDDLSPALLYAILRARSEVFVVEQNCVFPDMDDADQDCLHVVGTVIEEATEHASTQSKIRVAAYLRIVPPGLKFAEASIGRVITTKEFRGSGSGKALITEGIAQLEQRYPNQPIRIGAQAYLEKFYGSFGFVTVSDIYLEDDIEHVEMLRAASET
ncbi:GNAT family N-acetyltransferase [Undibacterium sp. RTI2.1]|uniref:GNAT family N-acetyltransferase n=1 Tax=unclassified Undibacterium TaxID=2630295 RepID=UPI002AB40260|nr:MULTISPECIES: GNAT family N-acetyltransferase [unclassified Undibacterium]MDY7538599.1 GNAT family N-acetyltransferase [Undibacterium sp. 5I1]MEB0031288.1 GNAT family N-acetyltransferase [Undibacterium sp. RTI2.1]MEB0116320.1 GNAT family N-acetyltransferase [Undibacterium sp. RTI2.2]MEB0231442.1 GNAT family N-acetyltransferase [Undibacterium sp. 10I3]MEB0258101.1 GNAT family N-acetyltransferase [Undibacterium sp. 5I1]